MRLGVISVVAFAVASASTLALSTTGILPIAMALFFACFASAELAGINSWVFRQSVTPDNLQARVNTSARMVSLGGYPVGALVAGFVAQVTNVRAGLVVAAGGVAVSLTIGVVTRLVTADPKATIPDVGGSDISGIRP